MWGDAFMMAIVLMMAFSYCDKNKTPELNKN